jgi:hypothetical protein
VRSTLVENADDPYDGLPPDIFEAIVTALVNGLLAQDAAVAAALQPCDTVELHGKAAKSGNARQDEGHDYRTGRSPAPAADADRAGRAHRADRTGEGRRA